MSQDLGMFSLKGRTALITGATGHLGRSMAYCLAEAGAQVMINSRSSDRSESLARELRAEGLQAESAIFDVVSKSAVENFADSIKGTPLHILVNNAYCGGAGNIEIADADDYANSYDVTVLAAHRLMKSLLPNLRKAVQEVNDASVINIASMYALVSPDQRLYASAESANPPFYGSAKAALLHWTRYAGCEFGKEGIRVNAISPGPFPSESVQKSNPDFIKSLSQKVPMGRIGFPDEMKGPTLFLASGASTFVNGANIVVDGGWTCW